MPSLEPLPHDSMRSEEILRIILPFEPDPVPEIDTDQPRNLLLFGALGSVAKRFYVDGINRLHDSFPNVRFIGVDLLKDEPDHLPALPWFEVLPYISAGEVGPHISQAPSGGVLLEGIVIDGIVIATPPAQHLPILKEWLPRGVPVWLEKPPVLPDQRGEFAELLYTYPDKLFPIDFYIDIAPVMYVIHHPEIWNGLGQLKHIHGSLVEPWPIETGREWLLDPSISGGGMGIDMLVHPIAAIDVILPNFSIKGEISVQAVARGRYIPDDGSILPGTEETYISILANAGDVDIHLDAGKGVDRTYYGITFDFENGSLEIFAGTETEDPFIKVQKQDSIQTYWFQGEHINYGGTFRDFFLYAYGATGGYHWPLGERQRVARNALRIMDDVYATNTPCVLYEQGSRTLDMKL